MGKRLMESYTRDCHHARQVPADGLPSGCEGKRVVNWFADRSQRIREFLARIARKTSTPGVPADSLALSPDRKENWKRRKPLPLLAKTKEPRAHLGPGFF